MVTKMRTQCNPHARLTYKCVWLHFQQASRLSESWLPHLKKQTVLLHCAYIAEIKVSCHQNDDAEATGRMAIIGDASDLGKALLNSVNRTSEPKLGAGPQNTSEIPSANLPGKQQVLK